MMSDARNLTCQEFQEQLPELIGAGVELQDHPHYQSCAVCRALMADLESIAEAARQLLPVEDPPDELWEQIERAIQKEEGEGGSQEPEMPRLEEQAGP
jgi:hypothetical protein